MAQYVESVRHIPVVVDMVDVDSDKWNQFGLHARFPWSFIYRREGKLLGEYERRMAQRVSAVLVSTDREAALMRNHGTSRVDVVSNGVDTEYFRRSERPNPPVEPTIIFTGDMAYFPNQQAVEFFARDVLPGIHDEVKAARFLIVGRNPNSQVIALGDLPGVEVTGAVPDVRPYLSQATVAVAPFVIAAGIQNKVLEAMASELPVVATTRAVQGLHGRTAQLIQTGETPQELAIKTCNLLKHKDFAALLGMEGRQSVIDEYSWQTALEHLMNVVEDPVGSSPRKTSIHVAP